MGAGETVDVDEVVVVGGGSGTGSTSGVPSQSCQTPSTSIRIPKVVHSVGGAVVVGVVGIEVSEVSEVSEVAPHEVAIKEISSGRIIFFI